MAILIRSQYFHWNAKAVAHKWFRQIHIECHFHCCEINTNSHRNSRNDSISKVEPTKYYKYHELLVIYRSSLHFNHFCLFSFSISSFSCFATLVGTISNSHSLWMAMFHTTTLQKLSFRFKTKGQPSVKQRFYLGIQLHSFTSCLYSFLFGTL